MAIGLVLIIEGLLPFLLPAQWRNMFLQVSRMDDGQIRFMGLAALLLGSLILVL